MVLSQRHFARLKAPSRGPMCRPQGKWRVYEDGRRLLRMQLSSFKHMRVIFVENVHVAYTATYHRDDLVDDRLIVGWGITLVGEGRRLGDTLNRDVSRT